MWSARFCLSPNPDWISGSKFWRVLKKTGEAQLSMEGWFLGSPKHLGVSSLTIQIYSFTIQVIDEKLWKAVSILKRQDQQLIHWFNLLKEIAFGYVKIAIENCPFIDDVWWFIYHYLPLKAGEHWLLSSLIYPLNLMIFDSYVSLPEGTYQYHVIPRETPTTKNGCLTAPRFRLQCFHTATLMKIFCVMLPFFVNLEFFFTWMWFRNQVEICRDGVV